MENPSKNPYVNRVSFVNIGKNLCGRMFNKVVRGCNHSAKYISKKSYYYNQKLKDMLGALPPEKKTKKEEEKERENEPEQQGIQE
jgi:predicted Fe-S protein YdhL (DUF1289 family)